LVLAQLHGEVAAELLGGHLAHVVAVEVGVVVLEDPTVLAAHVLEVVEELIDVALGFLG